MHGIIRVFKEFHELFPSEFEQMSRRLKKKVRQMVILLILIVNYG